MNLKIECQGIIYDFEDITSFDELKNKLNETEPSLIIESFTYQDDEDDKITLANDEDFSCFLSNSNYVIQAQSKINTEWNNKQILRSQLYTKRIVNKVKQLKEKQRINLLKRKEFCQNGLNKLQQIKKDIIEKEKLQKLRKQKIMDLEKKLKRLRLVKITPDIKQDFLQTDISKIIQKTETELNYDCGNKNKFRQMLDLMESELCDQFLLAYLQRAEKFIEQNNKIRQIISDIKQEEEEIQEENKIINLQKWKHSMKQTYYNMKLNAVVGLLKKI